MTENAWKFAQIVMWVFGIQTTVILGVLGFIWKNLTGRMESLDADMKAQGVRTDKLYEIYVSTQKEIYELRADSNAKFYEILKEHK